MSGAPRGDDASASLELVVLAPVFVLVALAALLFGRISEARQQVVEAARAGAEAASVARDAGAARWAAQVGAASGLVGRAQLCTRVDVTVDITDFVPGGVVAVTVACAVPLADLAVPGVPGATTVRASATAPIDPYRSVG